MLKRILISITVIIMVLMGVCASFILGTYWYYNYHFNPEVPQPVLNVEGLAVRPLSYKWHSSFAGGLLYKDKTYAQADVPIDLGVVCGGIKDVSLKLNTVEQGVVDVSITDSNGIEIWSGKDFNLPDKLITRNGQYKLSVSLGYPEVEVGSFGSFSFAASFDAYFEPKIATSHTDVAQGDAFVIRIYDMQENPNLTISASDDTDGTPIMAVFTKTGDSSAEAIIGVTHDRPVGEYHVIVGCDENEWDLTYNVVAGSFERQDLTVDTSNPQITEANSPAAYEQYRQKIYPLYEEADAERYWSGQFTRPVDWEAADRRISTSYGIFRYTNNNQTPRRHPAIDIAASEGTAVLAPNDGRVVFAEYLLNTGNTLVIEHGGGLKSYFYHLVSIDVESEDMVVKGQNVAKVGSTGYSTGPHLHYETRVGRQSLNPMLLMDGSGAVFFREQLREPQ